MPEIYILDSNQIQLENFSIFVVFKEKLKLGAEARQKLKLKKPMSDVSGDGLGALEKCAPRYP